MILNVNGRKIFFRCIDSVTEVRPGKFEVIAGQHTLLVEGGRKSGGAANEWFIHADGVVFNATVFTKSLAESLRIIDTV